MFAPSIHWLSLRFKNFFENFGSAASGVWSNSDETFHSLRSHVEFGQRLRRNLKNCGWLLSNWDKTCLSTGQVGRGNVD